MADDVNLRQEILNKTLEEVVQEDKDGSASPCVICLDSITEPGIAIPCNHANFDFLCLTSWLEERRACPLCKTEVTAVKYDLQSAQGPRLYVLLPEADNPAASNAHRSRSNVISAHHGRRQRPHRPAPRARPTGPEEPLTRRRHVYRNQLFSLRVGSNRLSQYRELTPELFTRDEVLVSRARKWIRRELQVFDFLNSDREDDHGQEPGRRVRPGQQRLTSRRANNAEFLLEYVIAILRTVDIKGSAGQAEDLLQEFIGRDNARLFLHELQSWLRSPYTSLSDWDRHVQYDDSVSHATAPAASPRGGIGASGGRRSTPLSRHDPRLGRVSKPFPSSNRRRYRSRSQDAHDRARRIQRARERYQPD